MKYRASVRDHIVSRLRVPKDLESAELWVIDNVLAQTRILSLTPGEQIYAAHSKFRRTRNKYLNNWNSARSELIVDLIPIPKPLPIDVDLELKPPNDEDSAMWLCEIVLRFAGPQLKQFVVVDLEDTRRALLPVIHESMQVLLTHNPADQSELVQYYHRQRYLLLRYYVDAHYHDLKKYLTGRRMK